MTTSWMTALKWLLLTINLNKTALGEIERLVKPYFLRTVCLGILFFDLTLSRYSQLGYLWLPILHLAALV